MTEIDDAIEQAVSNIHRRFTSGSGAPDYIVMAEKEIIRKEIQTLLGRISYSGLRDWAKEGT